MKNVHMHKEFKRKKIQKSFNRHSITQMIQVSFNDVRGLSYMGFELEKKKKKMLQKSHLCVCVCAYVCKRSSSMQGR